MSAIQFLYILVTILILSLGLLIYKIISMSKRKYLVRGQMIKLGYLEPGSLFGDKDTNDMYVKSEYNYPNGNPDCVILGSGEAAHFDGGHNAEVYEINVDGGL